MGGIVSRITPDVTLDHGLNESFNRLKNSFVSTPKYKVIDDKMIDPRSATLEINRTPLCLLDIVEEEGKSTPVARSGKRSKRRSSSRASEVGTSSWDMSTSFEFSSCARNSESNMLPWEPRPQPEMEPVREESKDTDDKYGVVVEELRECLSKVTMTSIYNDNESPEKSPDTVVTKKKSVSNSTPKNSNTVGTPNRLDSTPVNKELKKDWIWSPDYLIGSKSPLNKERTPLGVVSSNVVTSRLNSSGIRQRGKFWRGPLDERAKLQGENTPPPVFPPFGSPKSAPPINRHLHFPLK